MTTKPAIEVHNLTLIRGNRTLFNDVHFSIPQGSFCGILGSNGSGKSSLIQAICGIIPCQSIALEIMGKTCRPGLTPLSYMPQHGVPDTDYPISVKDVLKMAFIGQGIPRNQQNSHVTEMLLKLRLNSRANDNFNRLSGGEQQRVLLGRTLLHPAAILLLDEPFSFLDEAEVQLWHSVLKEVCLKGRTVLMVHHNLKHALDWFTYILAADGKGNLGYGAMPEFVTKGLLEKHLPEISKNYLESNSVNP
jgi:ABC-type Mn2+/Zn2+ transport system ATPase subunit